MRMEVTNLSILYKINTKSTNTYFKNTLAHLVK